MPASGSQIRTDYSNNYRSTPSMHLSLTRGMREGGLATLRRLAALAYRRGIRPLLPTSRPVLYAGVPISVKRKFGDGIAPASWIPPEAHDIPDYESTLVRALIRHVTLGDRVVIIGGGEGVTATIAAMQAGATGTVICYEGAAEYAERVRRTIALSGLRSTVSVRHAVVGHTICVWGSQDQAQVVKPTDLPECDVLELDCEGSEADILANMRIRPRVVIVETHGLYGAATEMIESRLRTLGYMPEVIGVAEERLTAFCVAHDIRVIAATRD